MSQQSRSCLFFDGPRTALGKQLYSDLRHLPSCTNTSCSYVPVKYRKFPDDTDDITIDKLFPRNDIAGKDAVFCMSMADNNSILQCLHVITVLLESFIGSLTIVCPFVPCATMERVEKEGTVATANTTARILSGLPSCGSPIRFLCYDLHTLGHRFYFHGNVVADLRSVVRPTVEKVASGFDMIVFPDEGAKKRYGSSLKGILDIGCCTKVRLGEERIVKVEQGLDVCGKRILIIDDLVRTGGTLKQCAKALKASGATDVIAFCVHAAGSVEELLQLREPGPERWLDSVLLTNTCNEKVAMLATAAHLNPTLSQFFDIVDVTGAIACDVMRENWPERWKVEVLPIVEYRQQIQTATIMQSAEHNKVSKESVCVWSPSRDQEAADIGLPLGVVVASTSKVKCRAAKQALLAMRYVFESALDFECINLRGVSVPSGVSEQPMTSEETRRGCLNRLLAAVDKHDAEKDRFIVSIENGLDSNGHDFAWVMVWDAVTLQTTEARSASVPVPYQVRRAFKRDAGASTYSQVMSVAESSENPHVTLCGVDRSVILQQAAQIALGQLDCLK